MIEKQRKRSLAELTAQTLDLPGDVVAGLPLVELCGDQQLRVENHKGILSYGTEEIHIGGGKLVVKVKGRGLQLKVMNQLELLITGVICSVELE